MHDDQRQAAGRRATWQPPLITVQAGTSLKINLVNKLSFQSGTVAIPTSIVIVGQVGGGLGAAPVRVPSPAHAPYGTTWPGTLGATDPSATAITVGRQRYSRRS